MVYKIILNAINILGVGVGYYMASNEDLYFDSKLGGSLFLYFSIVFVFSFVFLFIKESIYKLLAYFTVVWSLLSIVLIFNAYSEHDAFFPFFEKQMVALEMGLLFWVISLILIAYKSLNKE